MDYFDRFKARMAAAGQAYAKGNDAAPQRPLPAMNAGNEDVANQMVDLIIGCRMKGVDFAECWRVAHEWAEYEWGMVEPALAAKRAAAGSEREAA